MPIKLDFLWTDYLIFTLIGTIVLFAWYTMRHEHLRAPWRQVIRRPIAMAALVILLAYIVVGVLDSIHFRERLAGPGAARYSTEKISVLDKLAESLRTNTEKTYSAPFAVQVFAMETVEYPDGRRAREYPRLLYGGAHLKAPGERAKDIGQRMVKATLWGVLLWGAIAVIKANTK